LPFAGAHSEQFLLYEVVLAQIGDFVAVEEFHAATVAVHFFVGDPGAVGHVALEEVWRVAFLIADFSGVSADLHGPDAHLPPLVEGQFLDELLLDGGFGFVLEDFAGEHFAEFFAVFSGQHGAVNEKTVAYGILRRDGLAFGCYGAAGTFAVGPGCVNSGF
jgi:hypothetical protein